MRRVTRIAVVALASLLVVTTADAQSRRKRNSGERSAPTPTVPADKRDRVVAAPGTPFDGRPYWQALAQCGGIYFKLNSLYSLAAIQAKVVKPDPALNAALGKKSDSARRTATAFFEASERLLVADRGLSHEDAMLTYDSRQSSEGERHKTIDSAEKAAQPCPALYAVCRTGLPKICSEPSTATTAPRAAMPPSRQPPTTAQTGT
jgi:hypothetical protein